MTIEKATRFMRIPFTVFGFEVSLENMEAIATWCNGTVVENHGTPFVRVPVDRATHSKQTEAYVGMWVTAAYLPEADRNSFKVYPPEWLAKDFVRMAPEATVPVTINVDRVSSNIRPLPTQKPRPPRNSTTFRRTS